MKDTSQAHTSFHPGNGTASKDRKVFPLAFSVEGKSRS